VVKGSQLSGTDHLMKYLGKTFVNGIPDWSPEELVFNAIAWHEGYRFFGCSNDLSKAMVRQKKKEKNFMSFQTSITGWGLTDEIDRVVRKNPAIKFT